MSEACAKATPLQPQDKGVMQMQQDGEQDGRTRNEKGEGQVSKI